LSFVLKVLYVKRNQQMQRPCEKEQETIATVSAEDELSAK
jgi:hypothetical protein